jgi:hypothetical protein
MTGTAVNPLLRAAHLSKMNREYADGVSTVTLVIPWLESPQDRVQIYGDAWEKKTREDQDAYIRTWLAERAGLPLEADLSQGGIQIQYVYRLTCHTNDTGHSTLTLPTFISYCIDFIQHDCILA